MLEPIRLTSYIKPPTIEHVEKLKWYYNYDIKSEKLELPEDLDLIAPIPGDYIYNFIQIEFNSEPDYKSCVEAVIRQYITQSQEFDLINSFNKSALFGVETSDKDINKYKEYLDKIKEIKEKVKKDFNK